MRGWTGRDGRACRTSSPRRADGFDYLDPSEFGEFFAADVEPGFAAFEANSQVLINNANFHAPITTPAWKSRPSWMSVAGSDKTISPDLERWYGARSGSTQIEIRGASHQVYVSHPKEVAAFIEKAASSVH